MSDEKLKKGWLVLMLAVNPGCALIILNALWLFIEGEFMNATGIFAVVFLGSVFSSAFFIAIRICEKEGKEKEDRIEGLKKTIDTMHDISDSDKEQIINAIGYWLRGYIKRKEGGIKMKGKLNKFGWIMAVVGILALSWVGWVISEQPDFNLIDSEGEATHDAGRKILIDEYFDENINETISVYRIIGYPEKVGISWNMTNHIPNSRFACTFDWANHTVVSNQKMYINYRRGDINCVREKLTEQIKYNVQQCNTRCDTIQHNRIHGIWF